MVGVSIPVLDKRHKHAVKYFISPFDCGAVFRKLR
jgi:hypothetical protein